MTPTFSFNQVRYLINSDTGKITAERTERRSDRDIACETIQELQRKCLPPDAQRNLAKLSSRKIILIIKLAEASDQRLLRTEAKFLPLIAIVQEVLESLRKIKVQAEELEAELEARLEAIEQILNRSARERGEEQKTATELFEILQKVSPDVLVHDVFVEEENKYIEALKWLKANKEKAAPDVRDFLGKLDAKYDQLLVDPKKINDILVYYEKVDPKQIRKFFENKDTFVNKLLQSVHGDISLLSKQIQTAIENAALTIKKVHLKDCHLTAKAAVQLTTTFKNLQKLTLENCTLESNVFGAIESLTQLTKLAVFNEKQSSSVNLQPLYKLSQLKELILVGISTLDDQVVQNLLLSPKLKKLRLGGCPRITNLALEPHRLGAGAGPKLEYLNISDCASITGEGLFNLRFYTELKSVILPIVHPKTRITHKTFELLASLPKCTQCDFSLLDRDGNKWNCSYYFEEGKFKRVEFDDIQTLNNAGLDTILRVSDRVPFFRRALLEDMQKQYFFVGTVLRHAGFKLSALGPFLAKALLELINSSQRLVFEDFSLTTAFVEAFKAIIQTCPGIRRVTLPEVYGNNEHKACMRHLTGCFRDRIGHNKESAFAHAMLGELLRLSASKEAIQYLNQALEIEPQNSFALGRLGLLLSRGENPKEALSCLERSVQMDPTDVQVLSALGQMLRKEGRLDEAISRFEQAFKIDPTCIAVFRPLVELLKMQGHFDKAYQYSTTIQKTRPDDQFVKNATTELSESMLEKLIDGSSKSKEAYQQVFLILKKESIERLAKNFLFYKQSLIARSLRFLSAHYNDKDLEIVDFFQKMESEYGRIKKEVTDFQNKVRFIQPTSGEIISHDREKRSVVQNVTESIQDLHDKCTKQDSSIQVARLSSMAIQTIEAFAEECLAEIYKNEKELSHSLPMMKEISQILAKMKREAQLREGRLNVILARSGSEVQKSQELFSILEKGSISEFKRFVAAKEKNIYMSALDCIKQNIKKLDAKIKLFLSTLDVIECEVRFTSEVLDRISDQQEYYKCLESFYERNQDSVSTELRKVNGDLNQVYPLIQKMFHGIGEKITVLNLSNVAISPQHFAELVVVFKNVKELYLDGSNLADVAIDEIIKFTQLEILIISNNTQLSARYLERLSSLAELKRLYMNGCTGIDDQAVQRIVGGLPKLETLVLANCSGLTDQALRLSQSPSSLQLLNIRGCDKITTQGLAHLVSYKELNTILLPVLHDSTEFPKGDGHEITKTTLQNILMLPKLEKYSFYLPSTIKGQWSCSCTVKDRRVIEITYSSLLDLDNKGLTTLLQLAATEPSFRQELIKNMQNCYFLLGKVLMRAECNFDLLPKLLQEALLEIIHTTGVVVLDNLPLNSSLLASLQVLIRLCPKIRRINMHQCFKTKADSEAVAKLIEFLKTEFQSDPKNDIFPAMLGEIEDQLGHGHEAMAYFTQAIQLNPNNAFALGRRGRVHMSSRRNSEALRDLRKSADADPTDLQVLIVLGETLRVEGDLKASIHYLEEALKMDATNFTALYQLAFALRMQGRFDEARETMKKTACQYHGLELVKNTLIEFQRAHLDALLKETSRDIRERYLQIFSILQQVEPKALAQDIFDKKENQYTKAIRVLVEHFAMSDVEVAVLLDAIRIELNHLRFAVPRTRYPGTNAAKTKDEMIDLRKMILRLSGDPELINKAVKDNETKNPGLVKNLFTNKSQSISTILQRARGVLKGIEAPLQKAIREHGRVTRILALKDVPLTAEMVGDLAEVFQNMEELLLPGCSLSNAAAQKIALFTKLRKLDLSGNSAINEVGFQHLYGLQGLIALNLAGCHFVTDTVVQNLLDGARLPKLRRLILKSAPITDEAIPFCRSKSHLRHLDISASTVTDAGLEKIASYSGLRTLALPTIDGQITAVGLRRLAEISSLKSCSFSLQLADNKKWTCTYHLNSGKVEEVVIDDVLELSNAQIHTLVELTKGTSHFQDKLLEIMRKEQTLVGQILSRANYRIDTLPEPQIEALYKSIQGSRVLVLDHHPVNEQLFISLKRILENVNGLQGISMHNCFTADANADVVKAMIAFFEKESKMNERNDFSRAVLGEILWQQARHDEAVKYLKEAIAINKDNGFALALLGCELAASMDLLDDALIHLENAAQKYPKDIGILRTFGLVLDMKGRFDESASCFRQAIGIDPLHRNYWLLYSLSEVLRCQHKFAEALPLAEEYHESFPDNQGVLVMLGEVFGKIEGEKRSYAKAKHYLQKALTLVPDSIAALITLGELEKDAEQYTVAKSHLMRANALCSGKGQIVDRLCSQMNLSELFLAMEEDVAAKEALKSATIALQECKPSQHSRLIALKWDERLKDVWDKLKLRGVPVDDIVVEFLAEKV